MDRSPSGSARPGRWRRRAAACGFCLAGAWLLWEVVSVGLASDLTARGRSDEALGWRRDNPQAVAAAAESALATDPKRAAVLAMTAIGQAPLQASAYRVAAQSAQKQGDLERAKALMQTAGTLSLRDRPTQLWLLRSNLAAQDYPAAFRNGDALMRRSPGLQPAVTRFLLPTLSVAGADEALTDRLGQNPPWRTPMLTQLGRQAPDTALRLLMMLNRGEARARTEEVEPLLLTFVQQGEYVRAHDAWRALIPAAQRSPKLFNGEFEDRESPLPFNWKAYRRKGATVGYEPPPVERAGRALWVEHDGFSSSGPLVAQLLVLVPGRYRLSGQVLAMTPNASGRLRWTVRCIDGADVATVVVHPDVGKWSSFELGFDAPPQCPSLGLDLRPINIDRRQPVEAYFDGFSLEGPVVGDPRPVSAGPKASVAP